MEDKNFVAYEYKTKTIRAEEQPRVADMYEAFGWEITSASPAAGGVALSLKRDRKIAHRQELNKAERQAEDVYKTLSGLERAKTLGAGVFAYIFGIVSALVFGGGMSLIMTVQSTAALAGGIIMGVAGLVLCGVNYFIYRKLAAKKIAKVQPAIDENEEKFANLLERGNELLSAEIL